MPTVGSSLPDRSPPPRRLSAAAPDRPPPGAQPGLPAGPDSSVVIDCDRCLVRGDACTDCVVTCLLGSPPPQGRRLDDDQVHAIDVLAASGLVPPLRLVTVLDTVREAHVDPGA